jgi:hypothetical protein
MYVTIPRAPLLGNLQNQDAIKRNYIWEMADGIHHDAFNIGNETRFINGDEGPKVNVYGAREF